MQRNCSKQNPAQAEDSRRGGLVPLSRWAKEIGRSTPTIWRWRKLGWIKTVNICSKLYVAAEEIQRFEARAAAGEFAREPVVPIKEKAVAA
jgi:hypothetical protein